LGDCRRCFARGALRQHPEQARRGHARWTDSLLMGMEIQKLPACGSQHARQTSRSCAGIFDWAIAVPGLAHPWTGSYRGRLRNPRQLGPFTQLLGYRPTTQQQLMGRSPNEGQARTPGARRSDPRRWGAICTQVAQPAAGMAATIAFAGHSLNCPCRPRQAALSLVQVSTRRGNNAIKKRRGVPEPTECFPNEVGPPCPAKTIFTLCVIRTSILH